MDLKDVLTFTLLLVLFSPLQAEHRQKVIHIVVLKSMTLPDVQARILSFKKHLHKVELYRYAKFRLVSSMLKPVEKGGSNVQKVDIISFITKL